MVGKGASGTPVGLGVVEAAGTGPKGGAVAVGVEGDRNQGEGKKGGRGGSMGKPKEDRSGRAGRVGSTTPVQGGGCGTRRAAAVRGSAVGRLARGMIDGVEVTFGVPAPSPWRG